MSLDLDYYFYRLRNIIKDIKVTEIGDLTIVFWSLGYLVNKIIDEGGIKELYYWSVVFESNYGNWFNYFNLIRFRSFYLQHRIGINSSRLLSASVVSSLKYYCH